MSPASRVSADADEMLGRGCPGNERAEPLIGHFGRGRQHDALELKRGARCVHGIVEERSVRRVRKKHSGYLLFSRFPFGSEGPQDTRKKAAGQEGVVLPLLIRLLIRKAIGKSESA